MIFILISNAATTTTTKITSLQHKSLCEQASLSADILCHNMLYVHMHYTSSHFFYHTQHTHAQLFLFVVVVLGLQLALLYGWCSVPQPVCCCFVAERVKLQQACSSAGG